ncbi:MAG: 4-alpha-glucanotransferase [Nitrosomonadales bacterium]
MVIFPMQDVLDLSSEGRMNYPGQPEGNWEWRFSWDQLKPEHTRTLAEMSAENTRCGEEYNFGSGTTQERLFRAGWQ